MVVRMGIARANASADNNAVCPVRISIVYRIVTRVYVAMQADRVLFIAVERILAQEPAVTRRVKPRPQEVIAEPCVELLAIVEELVRRIGRATGFVAIGVKAVRVRDSPCRVRQCAGAAQAVVKVVRRSSARTGPTVHSNEVITIIVTGKEAAARAPLLDDRWIV